MKLWQSGSYTIEAAVYVPMMIFLILITLRSGISFYEESKNQKIYEGIQKMDTISEFYRYQMIKETGEEWGDD